MRPTHSSTILSEALNLPDPAEDEISEVPTVECPKPTRFGFMFPDLQKDPANLLPQGPETIKALVALGRTMIDKDPGNTEFDTPIPSVYTYFGQFIVHDMTFDPLAKSMRMFEEDVEKLTPLTEAEVNALENPRTGLLDLDSVYGPMLEDDKCYPVPRADQKMLVEIAAAGKVLGTDLPRGENPPYKARIGDPRNDENLILSQLHLAFLRAHNVVVNAGGTFEKAQALVRERYKYLVINDFLRKIADASDIDSASDPKKKIFDPPANDFFMPVEFVGAAFRFGHAMVRSKYHFNPTFKLVRLDELFTLTALPPYHHIVVDWVIDWTEFVAGGKNRARNLSPRLTEPLRELIEQPPAPNKKRPILSLAVIDLVRGYLLRLPTGQAVADKLKVPKVGPSDIAKIAESVSAQQRQILEAAGFLERTPLWFYILAEAAHFQNGNRLGPVGGHIVASVLLESEKRSLASPTGADGWDPILGKEQGFDVAELLRHASVQV